MITFSKFGHMGNLGNQLFQYASMIGLADKHSHALRLPPWKYSEYFDAGFPEHNPIRRWSAIKEPDFHYTPEFWRIELDTNTNSEEGIDISGWLQSEKYWQHCKDLVKTKFTFKPSFINEVLQKSEAKIPPLGGGGAIAISIRRGDYVDNPNYYQLPITYYLHALYKHFPDWQQRNIIIFSDDIPYCKIHFAAATNVVYAEGLNDIEQLCLMSQCKDFIIANSTFSWWGAYLGELRQSDSQNPPLGGRGAVIRPAHHFAGPLLAKSDAKDYYPNRWINFNHEGLKFDLTDTTFTIPLAYDHPHRKQNLDLSVCMLQRDFNTNIIIGEQGAVPKFAYMQQYCQYRHFFGMKEFHRTKMLNDMALMADTDIVVNWDADVLLPPLNILLAIESLRQSDSENPPLGGRGAVVYPYDGHFARVPRTLFKPLEKYLDCGIFQSMHFPGMAANDPLSVGGAVFVNKKAFIAAGMENEYMISYAPEDRERFHRFTKLGVNITKIPGPIYHIDHWRGPNSSSANSHFRKNHELYKQITAMTHEELTEYIKSWPWLQTAESKIPPLGGGGAAVDVVIPLGSGSTWKNNELRYCLRSIEKHLKNFRNIVIVGQLPEWFKNPPRGGRGALHLSLPDDHPANPARNIYYKLMAACWDNKVSENFIMFNDDYFLTKDVDAATIPHYHKEHDLKQSYERVPAGNTFRTALENTYKALTVKQLPIKNFDIHCPMLYNKTKFRETMQQYDWNVRNGYTAKSLYCNSLQIPGEQIFDCKIDQSLTIPEIEQRISDRFVFSVGDAGLFGNMKEWLQNRFSEKSQWE